MFLWTTASAATNTHLWLLPLPEDVGAKFIAANQTSLTVYQQRLSTAATQYRICMTRYSFCIGRPFLASRGGSLHDSARLSCTGIQVLLTQSSVIVWRVRGKTIRSVLCNIVCNNCAQCDAHTYEQTNSSLDWFFFVSLGPFHCA